jgi:nitroreductase
LALRELALANLKPGLKTGMVGAYMNSVFENIYSRRAVREYRQDAVPDDILKELIRAGTYAPSALDEQPWRFMIIKNRELMRKLSDRAKTLWMETVKGPTGEDTEELVKLVSDPRFNIFYDAPVLVLIFTRPGADSPEFDCALAAENMMLGARSLGIGSCWIGLASILGTDTELMKEIGTPEDHSLMSQLIFGYPVEKEIMAPERKKDVILNWIR